MSYKEQLKAKQAARKAAAIARRTDDYRMDAGFVAIYQQERGE